MKYLSILLIFSFSSVLAVEDEYDSNCYYEMKSFSLSIATSFNGNVKFELCNAKDKNSVHVIKHTRKREGELTSTEIITHEEIVLSQSEYKAIYEKFQTALKYKIVDYGPGRDGSTWCISSFYGLGSTQTNACFSTPSSETEKRGLLGMYNLGTYLWSFFKLDEDKTFSLY